jgi:cobalt-zinc-cadmium resistance protein CzcA
VLCSYQKTYAQRNFSDRMMNWLQKKYQPLLEKAIRIKYWLVGITVAIFAFSLFLFSRMGGEFIPQLQEGEFAFQFNLPQGSSLAKV